jgi:phage-related protein
MMDLYAQGIEDNAYKVADAVEGVAGDVAMGFTSDINYNVPDLAGYAADLSASITGTGSSRIEVPVILDGREIARASAWYMGEQLAWEAR